PWTAPSQPASTTTAVSTADATAAPRSARWPGASAVATVAASTSSRPATTPAEASDAATTRVRPSPVCGDRARRRRLQHGLRSGPARRVHEPGYDDRARPGLRGTRYSGESIRGELPSLCRWGPLRHGADADGPSPARHAEARLPPGRDRFLGRHR